MTDIFRKMTIKILITRICEQHELSVSGLARILGKTDRAVRYWLQGRNGPDQASRDVMDQMIAGVCPSNIEIGKDRRIRSGKYRDARK